MRFFFKSKRFKVFLTVILVIALVGAGTGIFLFAAPQSNIFGAIARPFQSAATAVSDFVTGTVSKFTNAEKTEQENKELKEQLAQANYDLTDYEDIKRQLDFYEDYLKIKNENMSFEFQPAVVIGRDTAQPFGTMTINAGTAAGVELYDPVITSQGLVGYVSETTLTQSVVKTILNPTLNVSALDNRTVDSGNITGDNILALDGMCKMMYLPRDNSVAAGDFIVSSGEGGAFPIGQIIGTVTEVKSSGNDLGYYAVIKPAVDILNVEEVMVITRFDGQTTLKPEE